MSDLSPKAKAIMDVFDDEYYHKAKLRQVAIAATLREVVYQHQYYNFGEGEDMILDARAILDIADELEAL